MDWQNDPELAKLFKDEMDERSSSLAEGADAVLAGEITAEISSQMLREGHTVKGTGRVMGYEGIARGGEACELVWRFIQQGDLPLSPMLGRTLALLAESIPHSLLGDDVPVSEALETLRTLIENPDLLAKLPNPLTPEEPASQAAAGGVESEQDGVAGEPLVFEPGPDGRLATPTITYEFVSDSKTDGGSPAGADPSAIGGDVSPLDEPSGLTYLDGERSVLDPERRQRYDLGGLVGAVEIWASEESVPVNAGRLFRMINDAAAVRIDLDSVVRQASQALSREQRGVSGSTSEEILESLEAVRRVSVHLESAALGLTLVPISKITATLSQLVKYLSRKLEKDVELIVEGGETVIDRQLLDRIGEVIRQLVVNAVTHGLEPSSVRVAAGKPATGTLRVSVSRDDQHLQLVISDDGAGIDWAAVRDKAIELGLIEGDPSAEELRSILFTKSFSANPDSSEFTGDGSGLARVTEIVKEVFGAMTLDSALGRGTSFVITMPAHRALQRASMFMAGGRTWGIPAAAVVETMPIADVTISVTEKGSSIGFQNETVPYASFASVAGLDMEGFPTEVMIIRSPTGLIALAVDEVLEAHEVATKDLGPLLSGSSVVSGVALLGGDDTVILVDAGRLADRIRSVEARPEGPVHTVLVVDDSQGVRQVVSGVLASHGFSTVSAGSVSDALAVLSRSDVDALVVDFSMPRADGVALIHMVRQRYGSIPVVMLSGVASSEDRSRAERAGVDAFFDKADFAKGALVEKLRDLIRDAADRNFQESSEEPVVVS